MYFGGEGVIFDSTLGIQVSEFSPLQYGPELVVKTALILNTQRKK